MKNTLRMEECRVDENAIKSAVHKIIPQLVTKIDACLSLSQQGTNIWLSEVVGEAPACLRRVTLRLELDKKGYALIAEPVLWDGKFTDPDHYLGIVCRGRMDRIKDEVLRPGKAEEIAHLLVTLSRLSLKLYGYQHWMEKIRDGMRRMRMGFVRFLRYGIKKGE